MIKDYYFENKSMYVVGDIHGDFNYVKGFVKQKKISDSVILFAGDVGLGFNKPVYYEETFKKLNGFLRPKNVFLLFGRGNHDDKKYFENELISFSNIKSIPDYSIIRIKNDFSENEFVSLYVGGGISIDRKYRIQNEEIGKFYYKLNHPEATDEEVKENSRRLYWPEEPPFFDIEKLTEISGKYKILNCVSSHTCPSFAFPQDKTGIDYWMKLDPDLGKDVDEERNTMTNIYNFFKENGVTIERWIYGHFHKHYDEIYENVKFTLLDCVQHKMDYIKIC